MQKRDAYELLEKYKSGLCTDEERALLRAWFHRLPDSEELPITDALLERMQSEMWEAVEVRRRRPVLVLWRRAAVAAAAVLLCGGGLVYLLRSGQESAVPVVQAAPVAAAAIAPGGQRAYLTLSDGRRISLTDAAKGDIAREAGVSIRKSADGELVYTVAGGPAASDLSNDYHTISTPRGGRYQVQLPDGSKVWLNAASSLRYPARFAGVERHVELEGEAYFEISASVARPFFVKTGQQEVRVLGTRFNITAYAEQGSQVTTLLSGKVQVAVAGVDKPVLLTPGQQSVVSGRSGVAVTAVDTTTAVAWKSGYLILDQEDFPAIMRRISRWYDVEIVYKHQPVHLQLGGRVSLMKEMSAVLAALASTGSVHFQVTGRTVTVTE